MEEAGLIVIGGSAGSLDVILKIAGSLPPGFKIPLVLVLHRGTSDDMLSSLVKARSTADVKEVEDKDFIEPNTIYIAPGGYHLLVEEDRSFSLDASEKVRFSRPSIDITFDSASEIYREELIAVLLSGANADGTEGLKNVESRGGKVIVQDPASAQSSYMPQHAVDQVRSVLVLDPENICRFLAGLHKPVDKG